MGGEGDLSEGGGVLTVEAWGVLRDRVERHGPFVAGPTEANPHGREPGAGFQRLVAEVPEMGGTRPGEVGLR